MYTIKQARQLAGMTQKEMAKELNVSESTYISYELYNTIMRMDTAMQFTKVTNISLDDIFFAPDVQKKCTKVLS